MTRRCNENIRRTLELVDLMAEIADEGDMLREDSSCGVLFGVLRDSAYKIRKLAEEEREIHRRKGWWRDDFVKRKERGIMTKKKYEVRGECPQCACGDVSFLGPDKLNRKFIGDKKEIETLCPACGTKYVGVLEEADEKKGEEN
jgi:hypothetical protein